MRLAVTGSIAHDHLMTFPGNIAEQLLPNRTDTVSLSFLVDELQVRRGGAGANIAFGLAILGLRPLLVGAAGTDFADYRRWLEDNGVDTTAVHASSSKRTAQFLCTTDRAQNQIATFYAGAMAEAGDIDLAEIADQIGGLDFVVIAPDDPAAMVRHAATCRARGCRFAADPSQQLARLSADEVHALIEGASYLFTNEYERELLLDRTKWTPQDVVKRVGVWVTTLGPRGVRIEAEDRVARRVAAAKDVAAVDPTGAGDAFRAGFVAAVSWGIDEISAARIGCQLAGSALKHTGTQTYGFDRDAFLRRYQRTYGLTAVCKIEDRFAPARAKESM